MSHLRIGFSRLTGSGGEQFVAPLLEAVTAFPVAIEIGILQGGTLQVERFPNRFPHGR